jgi:hypothetical protein
MPSAAMKTDGAEPPHAAERADPALGALRILNRHWREAGGYTSPNLQTYPWQWLWDSCFHALVWGAAGDRRAVAELESVFRFQRASGFVPHMGYALDPDAARGLWGIAGSSTITQPPMYAHAARRLAGWGFRLPAGLVERIERAMEDLWTRRRCADGLLSCFHPWEVADDSPRWDAWSDLPFDRFGTWRDRKLELVAALELDAGDAAVGSTRFAVRSAAFNALVAFNLVELAELTGGARWRERAFELTDALEDCWDPALATWADAADGDPPSGRVRTVDALLPVLVSREAERCDAVWAQLADPGAFAGRFGACGVHRAEPAFDPDAYWRGAAWPQLNYLLWVAARRQGRRPDAHRIAGQTRAAALTSGYAEHWNPDTGAGLGAAPQSWTGLWVVMGDGGGDR